MNVNSHLQSKISLKFGPLFWLHPLKTNFKYSVCLKIWGSWRRWQQSNAVFLDTLSRLGRACHKHNCTNSMETFSILVSNKNLRQWKEYWDIVGIEGYTLNRALLLLSCHHQPFYLAKYCTSRTSFLVLEKSTYSCLIFTDWSCFAVGWVSTQALQPYWIYSAWESTNLMLVVERIL